MLIYDSVRIIQVLTSISADFYSPEVHLTSQSRLTLGDLCQSSIFFFRVTSSVIVWLPVIALNERQHIRKLKPHHAAPTLLNS